MIRELHPGTGLCLLSSAQCPTGVGSLFPEGLAQDFPGTWYQPRVATQALQGSDVRPLIPSHSIEGTSQARAALPLMALSGNAQPCHGPPRPPRYQESHPGISRHVPAPIWSTAEENDQDKPQAPVGAGIQAPCPFPIAPQGKALWKRCDMQRSCDDLRGVTA